jgi:hypothetical protein
VTGRSVPSTGSTYLKKVTPPYNADGVARAKRQHSEGIPVFGHDHMGRLTSYSAEKIRIPYTYNGEDPRMCRMAM